ncbi:hypothetical protein PHYC_03968 [Phycisphaerales bacterium]|nr:hypothetical protein PHYC_03968 [Phycisphaerales bacterium]
MGALKPPRNPPPSTSEDLGEIIEKLDMLNERTGRMLDRWPSPDKIRSAVFWGVVVALLVVALVSMFVACAMRTA